MRLLPSQMSDIAWQKKSIQFFLVFSQVIFSVFSVWIAHCDYVMTFAAKICCHVHSPSSGIFIFSVKNIVKYNYNVYIKFLFLTIFFLIEE